LVACFRASLLAEQKFDPTLCVTQLTGVQGDARAVILHASSERPGSAQEE
jgi:hypothetical protein